VLSVSMIEKKGFDILFWMDRQLIMPIGSSSDTTIVFGVVDVLASDSTST
jgi:hypothetical protein